MTKYKKSFIFRISLSKIIDILSQKSNISIMRGTELFKKLELLGLSSREAHIYKVLLNNGFTKAGNIPRYVKMKRGIVYKVLEDLIEKGFVEKHGGDTTVARYAPLSPEKLHIFVEKQEDKLREQKEIYNSIYGNLKSQFNLLSGKPSVQYFEGEKGVEEILKDTLYSSEEIYTYADVDAVEKYFPKINEKHTKERKEHKIKKRILVANNKKGEKALKNSKKDELTEIRIIDKKYFPFGGVAEIYDNKILYITISNLGISGVLVEDKQIAQMHKYIFEALWEKSKKTI